MRIRRALVAAAVGAIIALPAQAAFALTVPDDCALSTVGGIITNPVGNVGCVTTSHDGTFGSHLVSAQVIDGWTYRVKSEGGSTPSSKVEVEFIRAANGDKCTYMIRSGEVRVSGTCIN